MSVPALMAVVECTFERQALSVFARAVYGGTIINPLVDLPTIIHVRQEVAYIRRALLGLGGVRTRENYR